MSELEMTKNVLTPKGGGDNSTARHDANAQHEGGIQRFIHEVWGSIERHPIATEATAAAFVLSGTCIGRFARATQRITSELKVVRTVVEASERETAAVSNNLSCRSALIGAKYDAICSRNVAHLAGASEAGQFARAASAAATKGALDYFRGMPGNAYAQYLKAYHGPPGVANLTATPLRVAGMGRGTDPRIMRHIIGETFRRHPVPSAAVRVLEEGAYTNGTKQIVEGAKKNSESDLPAETKAAATPSNLQGQPDPRTSPELSRRSAMGGLFGLSMMRSTLGLSRLIGETEAEQFARFAKSIPALPRLAPWVIARENALRANVVGSYNEIATQIPADKLSDERFVSSVVRRVLDGRNGDVARVVLRDKDEQLALPKPQEPNAEAMLITDVKTTGAQSAIGPKAAGNLKKQTVNESDQTNNPTLASSDGANEAASG